MLETLYKRDKTGRKVLSYSVKVVKDEPINPVNALFFNDTYAIVKETGQLDGKKTTHREVVTEGKQKRSAKEQAEAQALSDWKKKKDEGYKSLKDLDLIVVGPTEESGDKYWKMYNEILLPLLLKHLPESNTDASGNPKPMLAHEYHKHKAKVKFPCFIQPKYDGVRCFCIISPDDTIKFLSRSGKEYNTLSHIAEEISSSISVDRTLILDGEIYSDELNFQEIVSAVKALKPISKKLHYRIYDIANNEKQTTRLGKLDDFFGEEEYKNILLTDTNLVHDESEIGLFFSQYIEQGFEGAMLRSIDGEYCFGGRSHDLLKYKEFDEAEFEFISFAIGKREEDLIAICKTKDGKNFRAKVMGDAEQKIKLRDDEAYGNIKDGTKVTIKFFGYTNDGLPRFPICKGIRDYE